MRKTRTESAIGEAWGSMGAVLSFDHVIVAVRDFDAAARRLFDEHGLASVPGGRHHGLGTGNRIVPLGSEYLELMAIVDRDEAASGVLGPWLERLTSEGDRLGALCVRTDDVDGVAERLGLTQVPMGRTTPEGREVSWRLAGLDRTLADPSLPFFIQWDDAPDLHPGRAQADHGIEPHGISWVEMSGDPAALDQWLGEHSLDIRMTSGAPGVTAVGIETDAGDVVLT